MGVTLAELTADHFSPLIGETLTFQRPAPAAGSEPARMKLLEVKRHKASVAIRREPFSLFFAMKHQEPLGDGLHRFVHPGFEPSDLLISRVTAPKYEAL